MDNPQLRMIHKLASLPRVISLPEGYCLRESRASDVIPMSDLLTAAFQEPWDCARVLEILLENSDVPKTWVIEHGGTVVATASYQLKPSEFPNCGWVHYVGASASHSGKGLGYIVSQAVVEEAAAAGNDAVRLTTDDWRLPAIRTYLKLGFEPEMWHDSHPNRWAAILAKIESK